MKKKRLLKSWVKTSLVGLISLVVLTVFIQLNNNLEKDFVSNCENMGYSTNYCLAHS